MRRINFQVLVFGARVIAAAFLVICCLGFTASAVHAASSLDVDYPGSPGPIFDLDNAAPGTRNEDLTFTML
jgi:hypothetical protein